MRAIPWILISARVQAAKPTAPWDEVWGKGFLEPQVFTGIVYASLGGKAN